MNKEQKARELYRIAYECSARKVAGCQDYCGNCQLNVALYEPDITIATLIKTTADIDFGKTLAVQRQKDTSNIVFVIFIIALIGLIVYGCRSCINSEPPIHVDSRMRQQIRTTCLTIPSLLRDTNNDSKINCQDYAWVFYQLWPYADSSFNRCAIIENIPMRHAYIAIRYKSKWIYVEPNSDGKMMEEVWGSRFVSAFGIDKTNFYRRVCIN